MSLVIGWIFAVVAGLLLASVASFGIVSTATKNPPVGPQFVTYGSR
jgi:hypothetical protein